MRSARTSRIRALVCDVSVTMPACDPDREIAWLPRSLSAIAHRAHEIRSPVESSMSISRGWGSGEISWAISTSWSVVAPRADSTATTEWPSSRARTIRFAALIRRSASATDVPPNFITTMPFELEISHGRLRIGERRALKARDGRTAPCPGDLVRVLEVGAHRQAAREARHDDVSIQPADGLRDVERGRLPGGGRVGRDHHLAHLAVAHARDQLGDLQILGIHAVDR